jgi:hypothetical protein
MSYTCHDCEQKLDDSNSTDFGGFDGSNYLLSRTFGMGADPSPFIKCDSCFYADVDRALESMYE